MARTDDQKLQKSTSASAFREVSCETFRAI